MLVVDDELSALIEGIVTIMLATRGANLQPSIGRAMGETMRDGNTALDLFVPVVQWPEVGADAVPGALMAATFSRPTNYETVQVKGTIAEHTPASAEDLQFAVAYIKRIRNVLDGLGVSGEQMRFLATGSDLRRIRIRPEYAFQQTPGPGAGSLRESHGNV
jgi:hypothetical protein